MTHMLIGAVACLAAIVVVSYGLEAIRPAPAPPKVLSWAPDIPIHYEDIGGMRIRYIATGAGPNLVLLHTLRTQLDLFETIVPELARSFTIYALDYPGHGYSDIPKAQYDADFFVRTVEQFLDCRDLRDVTLCGVSIGGAIALIMAGRSNARVTRVVAVNPYDYARGRGMTRSSLLGWLITVASETPVIAGTIMRLRNFVIMKAVLEGGVADPHRLPSGLLREMYAVGNRSGHYKAFISLLRHAASWEVATNVYGNIAVPVCLIWGGKDWSRPAERERDRSLVPGAVETTIDDGGHFLPLDQPRALTRAIVQCTAQNTPGAFSGAV